MNRPGRPVPILSIVAYIVAGLLAAGGIIVGLVPYNVADFDAVCPSALGHLTGAVTPLQSVADRLASAPCVAFEGQMTALMFILSGARGHRPGCRSDDGIVGTETAAGSPAGDRPAGSGREAHALSAVHRGPGRRIGPFGSAGLGGLR
jgi:hypothetical protein